MSHSAAYTLRFALAVSFVASVLVATTSVILRERQNANRLLDRHRRILDVGGLITGGESVPRDTVTARFMRSIRPVVVNLQTGDPALHIDPLEHDQRAATLDPSSSRLADENLARVRRLPIHAVVYHVLEADTVRSIILPIEGQGLWATIYGFIALSADLQRVDGITFYEHAETPGLGGEINEPSWREQWRGKRPFDDQWNPQLEVLKGEAPPGTDDPFAIDGLSGATLTGRAVMHLVRFWLGPDGFGPYLERYRRDAGIS